MKSWNYYGILPRLIASAGSGSSSWRHWSCDYFQPQQAERLKRRRVEELRDVESLSDDVGAFAMEVFTSSPWRSMTHSIQAGAAVGQWSGTCYLRAGSTVVGWPKPGNRRVWQTMVTFHRFITGWCDKRESVTTSVTWLVVSIQF